MNRLRAEFGMTGEQSIAAAQQHSCIAMMHGLDLKNGGWRQVGQKNPTFDFRPDDTAIHFVGQVGVRVEHVGDRK